MNGRVIGYWVTTALTALSMIAGGAFDLTRSPQVLEGLTHLGYAPYFALILGAWKVAGGLTILVPKLPRLKEWAYAGIIFDLTGASASHAASGDGPKEIMVPLVLTVIALLSWYLRPASRKLDGPLL